MIKYYVFDPAGNVTILVDTAVPAGERLSLARALMEENPQAEQAGFARVCGRNGKPEGKLTMAGGEFCGNGAMCTAVLKCLKEELNHKTDIYPREISVKVAGTPGSVQVRVTKRSEGEWLAGAGMRWPRGFGSVKIGEKECPLVDEGGIFHAIINGSWEKEKAEKLIREVCREKGFKALGFMFLDGKKLTPLVYVNEAGTLFWERSCASGACAAGAWLAMTAGTGVSDTVFEEPGGSVGVRADSREKSIVIRTGIRLIKAGTV